ncbi:Transcription factor [Datura stramonium]|uniref:Transcription factor n=1 Tax=Datura stramonium TaxID=4076 RepID=A0ABS8S842_DATST|nr:Transcription factor [Datura stramonium]
MAVELMMDYRNTRNNTNCINCDQIEEKQLFKRLLLGQLEKNKSPMEISGVEMVADAAVTKSSRRETESKQHSSSSAFQIANLSSQVSNSAGKPPLSSSSLKRKCSLSENAASGKCSGSSGRCHCSKRRKLS